jgi:hypothetical protein
MNVQEKITSLLNFLLSKRRSGTTTLLQKIASENDVFVLVETKEESDIFYDGKAITLSNLRNLNGVKAKPILIEASLLMSLLRESDNKICTLYEKNIEYVNHLLVIESEIKKFRNRK